MAVIVTGLAELQRDLARSAQQVNVAIRPVISRAGLNIKNRMRAEAAGHRHAPRLPSTINYTLVQSGTGVEVGPRLGGPGSLAFYYFGNSKVNASIPDPVIALHAEANRVMALMAAAATAPIGGGS